jgi:hypothetical protein
MTKKSLVNSKVKWYVNIKSFRINGYISQERKEVLNGVGVAQSLALNNYNHLYIRFPQNGTHCICTLKFINVASGCYSVVFYIHNHLVVQKGFEDTKGVIGSRNSKDTGCNISYYISPRNTDISRHANRSNCLPFRST